MASILLKIVRIVLKIISISSAATLRTPRRPYLLSPNLRDRLVPNILCQIRVDLQVSSTGIPYATVHGTQEATDGFNRFEVLLRLGLDKAQLIPGAVSGLDKGENVEFGDAYLKFGIRLTISSSGMSSLMGGLKAVQTEMMWVTISGYQK